MSINFPCPATEATTKVGPYNANQATTKVGPYTVFPTSVHMSATPAR